VTNAAWKLLAEWEIHPCGCALAPSVDTQTCRSVGIPSNGLDELRAATSLREKAGMRHMTDLARA